MKKNKQVILFVRDGTDESGLTSSLFMGLDSVFITGSNTLMD